MGGGRGDGAVERKVEEDRRGCKDLPLITPLLATQNFFYVERERDRELISLSLSLSLLSFFFYYFIIYTF